MRLQSTLVIGLLTIAVITVHAQVGFNWSQVQSFTSLDAHCTDVIQHVDAQGNVYMAGNYQSVEFRAGAFTVSQADRQEQFKAVAGSYGLDQVWTANIFILKINHQGDVEWLNQIDPVEIPQPMDIVADESGNVWLAWQEIENYLTYPEVEEGDFITRFDASGEIVDQFDIGAKQSNMYNELQIQDTVLSYLFRYQPGWSDPVPAFEDESICQGGVIAKFQAFTGELIEGKQLGGAFCNDLMFEGIVSQDDYTFAIAALNNDTLKMDNQTLTVDADTVRYVGVKINKAGEVTKLFPIKTPEGLEDWPTYFYESKALASDGQQLVWIESVYNDDSKANLFAIQRYDLDGALIETNYLSNALKTEQSVGVVVAEFIGIDSLVVGLHVGRTAEIAEVMISPGVYGIPHDIGGEIYVEKRTHPDLVLYFTDLSNGESAVAQYSGATDNDMFDHWNAMSYSNGKIFTSIYNESPSLDLGGTTVENKSAWYPYGWHGEHEQRFYYPDLAVGWIDIKDVVPSSGIDIESQSWVIYPNPANESIQWQSDGNVWEVHLYDITGKQVLTTTTTLATVNVSTLQPGVYWIKVNHNGQIHHQRFIIR